MVIKRIVWVLALVVIPCVGYADIDVALKEANESFTYQRKPSHPGTVQETNNRLTDRGLLTTISVDVAAPHRNEYNEDDVEIRADGSIFVTAEDGRGYYYYKWLGRLENGLHVLETGESGGGSGTFMDLFFVRFDKGRGINHEGEEYDRLLMTIVRVGRLGDRDDGEITVLPDKVIMGESRYRDEPVILEFGE
jgi:hypothetical protein